MHQTRMAKAILAVWAVTTLGFMSDCTTITETTINTIDQPLSIRDARMALMKLREPSCETSERKFRTTNNSYIGIKDVVVYEDSLVLIGNNGNRRLEFSSMEQLGVEKVGRSIFLTINPRPSYIGEYIALGPCGEEAYVHSLANALLVLKQAASQEVIARGEALFSRVAQAYREASVKPQLDEDGRRFRIQAEAAVRANRFQDAADSYEDALTLAPWWPQGHFNRALVLGEAGDYRATAREMKSYLLLVPDAPNARAAQDQIYEWERKVNGESK